MNSVLSVANKSIYPPGATNANWFSAFNAVGFQITLGSPMILYAKSIGATATVLGIIAALTPLLTIAQIPAARLLVHSGYRRFVFRGWGLRTIFVFAIAAVPPLTFLNDVSKVAIILFFLFLFNLLRGISSGGWLPWITDLIPEHVRGRFLSRDQLFQQTGSLVALAVSAALLGGKVAPWKFSAVFLVSGFGGVVSLFFLLRIPDIEARELLVNSTIRVPWREIVSYPPFLRLTIFTVLWVFAVGAVGVFNVPFLKNSVGYSESGILYLTTFFFMGAMVSLPLVGRLLDRIGSKIVLQCALVVSLAYHTAFWLLAARVVAPSLPLLAGLYFCNGMAGANFGLAHVRLTMNTMPPMGRSHFFAFFTVITSLALGASPMIWGLALDAIGGWEKYIGALAWNRFSIFYFCVTAMLAGVGLFSITLHEKREATPGLDPRATVFRATLRWLLRLGQR